MAKKPVFEGLKKGKLGKQLKDPFKIVGVVGEILSRPHSREELIYHNKRRMEFLELNLKSARSAAERKNINALIKRLDSENVMLEGKRAVAVRKAA